MTIRRLLFIMAADVAIATVLILAAVELWHLIA